MLDDIDRSASKKQCLSGSSYLNKENCEVVARSQHHQAL